jgi:DNA-binding CsgD family transcriptional regulator
MTESQNDGPLERAIRIWKSGVAAQSLPDFRMPDPEAHRRLLSIFNVGDYYCYVFNLRTSSFEYVSDSLERITGLKPGELSVSRFFSMLHPDDVEGFVKIEARIAGFFGSLPPEHMLRYKARYDFRLRRTDGRLIRLLSQIVLFESDEENDILKSFCVHTDITDLKDSNVQGLAFIGIDGLPSFVNVEYGEVARPSVFTARQLEILRLLVSGANRVKIAGQLHISKHTVDTHRRTIFRIAGVHSVHELLKKAASEGWI